VDGKLADNIRGRLRDQAQQLDDLIDPLRDEDGDGTPKL
jgi:hypothetical protein